jgi:predicted enzyme related to lactoylglutathione lyase
MKMNPVVHFEMPARDRKRIAEFYTSVFGWQTQMLAINGGFFPKSDDRPAQYPSVVIAVDDIQAHMKKVEEAGGEVLGEPIEIPGVGQYVAFFDTEGNRVSMLQPKM